METTRRGVSHYLPLSIVAAFWLAPPTLAQVPFTNNDGLYNFVTRPEIRAPKLDVRIYDRDAVTPGYWFVAPYNTNNGWESHQGPLYETCQVGPAIYDSNGDLIWSGACDFNNMNAFDFKPIDYGGKKYLSLNVGRGTPSVYGAGVILSDTYEVVREVQMSGHTDDFNQHEFNVIDDGDAVLYVTEQNLEVPAASIGLVGGEAADEPVNLWARSNGIVEESLLWGREETVNFEWECVDGIPLNESTFPWPESAEEGRGWDYMHMNSIDKFPNGDYLFSMRYSDSLMRVSGEDKSIVWRMGGKASDFEMKDGFHFSRQHHGRIVSTSESHTILTLLDNAAGSLGKDEVTTASESSALVVLLQHDPANRASWTAEVLRRYPRPDGDYSHLRGSVQILSKGQAADEDESTFDPTKTPYPSSLTHIHDRYPDWETANLFVGWSKNGYMTEFRANGSVVAEARFVTSHLDTYRAYKHRGFVGRPVEPPALVAYAFGDVTGQSSAIVDGSGRGVGQTMTVAYVSWNGATEVKRWRAFGKVVQDGGVVVLGGNGPTTYDEAYGLGNAVDPVGGKDEVEEDERPSSTLPSPSPSSSPFPSSSYPLSTLNSGGRAVRHRRRDKIPTPSDTHPAPVTTHLGTFARAGFETVLTIPNLPVSHIWVEALDARGNVLGQSPVVRVVVPGAQRPYAPADVLNGDDDDGVGGGDFVFADESEGLIGLVKVPPQAAVAGSAGWGYASVNGVNRGGEAWGWLAVMGVGAGVGVGAAMVVLGVWWGWSVWSSSRKEERIGGGKRRRWKGKAPAVDKGKYRAVAGDEEDEDEAMELVETGSESRSSDGGDEYLGRLDWAPMIFGRGTAGVGGAGRGRGFDEEMTLGEVRRGMAQMRQQQGYHQRNGSQAEYWGSAPLVFQAKNKWDGERM
ncbi:hypothetical protein DBV05_g12317 [Lasiodiplodia theobromae]|uniref:ASST-domain-containing protein n=1 Tax=Lasiodiplodia theobromae TaxID=45133 RepID=A0A5N5CUM0_9PEZI|nr:hypothetical protein DBV05_g12317 [Lasiodiplodia theobromae]